MMSPTIPRNPGLVLQPRHEYVEVHAIDPLDRKLHMMAEDVGMPSDLAPASASVCSAAVLGLVGFISNAMRETLLASGVDIPPFSVVLCGYRRHQRRDRLIVCSPACKRVAEWCRRCCTHRVPEESS
jgi:hypothetical protein